MTQSAKVLSGKKFIASAFSAVAFALTLFSSSNAQVDSAALRKDFPELFGRFEEKGLKVDYVIVIDRSLSMASYWPTVKQGINGFVDAIPAGDQFSVITFANSNRPEPQNCTYKLSFPSRLVDSERTRTDLKNEIERLCTPDGGQTDLGEAIEKTLKELYTPGGSSLKIVFFFTDFIHDPPETSKYLNKYSGTEDVWQDLAKRTQTELSDKTISSHAILLHTGGNTGRDIKLGKTVFPDLDRVDVNKSTIQHHVNLLRNTILRLRLKASAKESQSQSVEIASIYSSGPQLIARVQVRGTELFTGSSIKGIVISELNAEGFSPYLTSVDSPDKEYTVDERGQLEVPVAVINDAWFAWKGEPKVSFKLSGIRVSSPADEITRLGLSNETSFESFHRTEHLALSGGEFQLWTLVFLGLGLLVAALFIKRRTRQRYLSGTVTIRNSENAEIKRERLATEQKRLHWGVGKLAPQIDGYAIEGVNWGLHFLSPKRSLLRAKRGIYLSVDEGEVTLKMNGTDTKLNRYGPAKRISGQISILAGDHTVVFTPELSGLI